MTAEPSPNGGYDQMMMTRLSGFAVAAVLALSLAFGAAAPAVSQEIPPEQLELARKYVDLTNKAQIYEAIAAMTAAQTSKLLSQSNPEIATQIDADPGRGLDGGLPIGVGITPRNCIRGLAGAGTPPVHGHSHRTLL